METMQSLWSKHCATIVGGYLAPGAINNDQNTYALMNKPLQKAPVIGPPWPRYWV